MRRMLSSLSGRHGPLPEGDADVPGQLAWSRTTTRIGPGGGSRLSAPNPGATRRGSITPTSPAPHARDTRAVPTPRATQGPGSPRAPLGRYSTRSRSSPPERASGGRGPRNYGAQSNARSTGSLLNRARETHTTKQGGRVGEQDRGGREAAPMSKTSSPESPSSQTPTSCVSTHTHRRHSHSDCTHT